MLYVNIGRLLAAQGNFADALARYRASLAIRKRLASDDPGNVLFQSSLAMTHGILASAYRDTGHVAEALAEFQNGRNVIAELVEQSPDSADWKESLASFDRDIAALDRQTRKPPVKKMGRAIFLCAIS